MNTLLENFHFLRPLWLFALVPGLVLLAVPLRRPRAGGLEGLVDADLLPHLLLEQGRLRNRAPLLGLGCCWLLAILALAGPTWKSQSMPVFRARASRVIVLDLSESMLERDITPSRLERARLAIRTLLRAGREGRTGLVVFAGDAHVVAPLTSDTATIVMFLSTLEPDIMPIPGNSASGALEQALVLLERAGARGGRVLLVSDGIGDQASALDAAGRLRRQGHRLSVLMAGRDAAAAASLRELARAGGGRVLPITALEGELAALVQEPGTRRLDRAEQDQASGVLYWMEAGPWLLLPLLLLAALAARRNLLFAWTLALLCGLGQAVPARAWDLDGLWLRQDQQAQRLLEEGRAAEAARLFTDPMRQGQALYQAGDFQAAAQAFARAGGTEGFYNQGNALARAGRLQEALAAYDRALELDPDMEDARVNRDLVEQAIREQQTGDRGQQTGDRGQGTEDGKQGSGDRRQGAGDGRQGAGDRKQEQGSGEKEQGPEAGARGGQQEDGKRDTRDSQEAGQQAQGAGNQQPGRDQERNQGQATGRDRDQNQDQGGRSGAAASRDGQRQAPEAGRVPAAPAGQEGRNQEEPGQAVLSGGEEDGPEEGDEALDAWLREVPDDPAGLLRQKFLMESRQRARRP